MKELVEKALKDKRARSAAALSVIVASTAVMAPWGQ
ncbi:MAG: hypothetical protein BWY68_00059 [bacterium ADurb.Bin400]|nr:MAG: hypothetical protein BWY68_00059 [bacterium ADurb.Bin400]